MEDFLCKTDPMQDKTDHKLVIRDCGLMPYDQALSLQNDLLNQRQHDMIPNTVLLLEHPPVITLGARETDNKLLTSPQTLKTEGIDIHHVRRGGGATAHNPGQIVMYPIMDLRSLDLGVNTYVRDLESIAIELLARLGITAARRKGFPGLWTEQKKIASVGVKVKKWVTFHGIAININNDLSIFKNIVPCGIDDVQITNVLEITKKNLPIEQVKKSLAQICRQHWA